MSSCDSDTGPQKINFLTTQAKFEGQYFSNRRCEIVKKIFFVQQFDVFYSDELKNAYYTNTSKFYLYLKSKKKRFFLIFGRIG